MPQLPNVIGQSLAEAFTTLAAFQNVVWRDEDLSQIKLRNQPPPKPRNRVVWQHPAPPADGADVPVNVRVTLVVAYEVPYPDCTGMTVDAADRLAAANDLTFEYFEENGAPAAHPIKRTRIVLRPKNPPPPPKKVNVGDKIGVILFKVP